jgi:hypothetical protein
MLDIGTPVQVVDDCLRLLLGDTGVIVEVGGGPHDRPLYFWIREDDRVDGPTYAVLPHEIEEIMEEKPVDNNKKTAAALGKPKLSSVPPVALYAMGAGMDNGADKYGRFNYRESSVTASVFYDALQRHLTAWYNGEDHAEDSGLHHLAHLLAGGAIVLDAISEGNFVDDRSYAKEPGKLEGMFKHE